MTGTRKSEDHNGLEVCTEANARARSEDASRPMDWSDQAIAAHPRRSQVIRTGLGPHPARAPRGAVLMLVRRLIPYLLDVPPHGGYRHLQRSCSGRRAT